MNQFSSNSKYYLTITNDNRLHLYDTNTSIEKHSYIEKNHLTHSYVSVSWGKDSNNSDLGIFAVATSDGIILIWDFSRGVVIQTIGNKNNNNSSTSNLSSGSICQIAFINNFQSILVTYSSSSTINEYSVATGELIASYKGYKKGSINKIAVNPTNSSFIIANTSMKYFNHREKSSQFKISSTFPSDGPTSINYTPCGQYLICTSFGSHNSDDLMIYHLSTDIITAASTSESNSTIEPSCSIPINGRVENIQIQKLSNESYLLLILFQDHKGCLLTLPMKEILAGNTTNIQQIDLFCDIDGVTSPFDNILSLSFLSSTHQETNEKNSILLAVGKISMPQFIKYPFTLSSLSTATSTSAASTPSLIIPLRSNEKKKDEKKSSLESSSTFEVNLIGPHESGGLKRPIVALKDDDNFNNNGDEEDEEDAQLSGHKRIKRMNEENKNNSNSVSENNLTLEERLRNITTTLTNLEHDPEHYNTHTASSSTSTATSSLTKTTTGGGGAAGVGGVAAITSDSLVILLEQSLQSLDDNLLEQCLSQSSENVIYETIQRLPSSRIIQLLKKLIAKFEKKSSRGLILIKWISMILRCHTSYLLSVHDLSSQLIGLNTILEQRLSTYMKLSSLAGRLDLIMSHLPVPVPVMMSEGESSLVQHSHHHNKHNGEGEGREGSGSNGRKTGGKSDEGQKNKHSNRKNQPKQVIYED